MASPRLVPLLQKLLLFKTKVLTLNQHYNRTLSRLLKVSTCALSGSHLIIFFSQTAWAK